MATDKFKDSIHALWAELRQQSGITGSLAVTEQITFLMHARLLDIRETRDEQLEASTGQPFTRRFRKDQQHLRWSRFRQLQADEMLPLVRDQVFDHFRMTTASEPVFADLMQDTRLMIEEPGVLARVLAMIDQLPLTDEDKSGSIYEYLLGGLTTTGMHRQFRTPRHIIDLMVNLLEPKATDLVCDPTCGTGGFLAGTVNYLKKACSSQKTPADVRNMVAEPTGKAYAGNLHEEGPGYIQSGRLYGYDKSISTLRLAAMNLALHGVDNPDIRYQDSLSGSFIKDFPDQASEAFDLILSNPPFRGNLEFDRIDSGLLKQVLSRRIEIVFPALILRMLKTGGRAATIVPGAILFGLSSDHHRLRRLLVDDNKLEAVISLPSEVFRPYAASILVFTKGGRTDQVFFYDVQADGFDRRRRKIKEDDLPDCLARWRSRDPATDTDRAAKAFFVPVDEIRESEYDLSLIRYREIVYEEEVLDPPHVILKQIRDINDEVGRNIAKLAEMLK